MAWDVVTSTTSLTSGAFVLTGLSLSTYKSILIQISAVTVTTDGTDCRITFYVSGSEVTSTYTWAIQSQSTGGTGNSDSASSQASCLLCSNDANWDTGNASTKSFYAWVQVDSPGSTALHKRVVVHAAHIGPTGNAVSGGLDGYMGNAGAIDGIKVGGTSNLTAGKVTILGLA